MSIAPLSYKFKACEMKSIKKKFMTDTTVLLSFFYAPYCSRQFILFVGGFVPFRPLTAHLFIVLSMANLLSQRNCRIYFLRKRVGDLQGGRDLFLERHILMRQLEDSRFGGILRWLGRMGAAVGNTSSSGARCRLQQTRQSTKPKKQLK